MQVSKSNNNFFILNFNKIFIKFKNTSINAGINLNFFFLTNNFFLINNLNSSFFNFLNFNLLIFNDLKKIFINVKRNDYKFFKINNKRKNFLRYFKYILKFKFKYIKFFNYTFFFNKKYKINSYLFLLKYLVNFNFLMHNFKYLSKNWNFLIGSSISPFLWDLYSKKNWIRKKLNYNLLNNRYFFNKFNKNSKKKRIRKYNFLKYNNYTKKYILNNYFYVNKLNKKYKKSNLRYVLKISVNFKLSKKKNYNWFLTKPYLFLNTYKNYKLNKRYFGYFLISLYKKYFKFFNILKRINLNTKYKKTNNFFFSKIFFNSDLIGRSYKNKYFSSYIFIKKKFPFFKFKKSYLNFNLKKKNLKKKIFYFWFFKIIYNSKILKKNKIMFNFKIFSNKKIKIIRSFRKLKKRNIYVKSFNIIKKNYNFKIFSLMLKKFKLKFKSKYRLKLKINKLFLKNNIKKKIKINLYFKIKNIKFPLKFFFVKYLKKGIQNPFLILKKNNYLIFFKWNFLKINKNNKYRKNINFEIDKKNNFNFLKKEKKLFYFTKTRLNFLLNFYGFLFLNNNTSNYLNCNTSFFNIKKNLYSFSYKNEIQRFILKKYIKNNHLLDYSNKNILFLSYFNPNNPLSALPTFYLYNNLINDKNNSSLNHYNHFFIKNNQIRLFLNKNFSSFLNWNYYTKSVNFYKNTHNEDNDFNIKRIRFKPGYMNLWRDVRTVLKNSLSLNFRYQYKLTNFLTKYKKFINFKTFLSLEMKLSNILIKSRLFNDINLANIFIKNNLIYLNGVLCNNRHLQIFIGDFIQIVICFKYYILSRWFLNLNLKKKNKIKNVFKRKNSFYSDEKKRSYNMPKWILFNKNLFDDCASYMEVDYFTLSSFILYEPFLWSDINPYNLLEQKFSIINLYNWKYIT